LKRKNTTSPTLCISIAKQSGMFGTIVHNAGYKALNLNYFYKAFSVDDNVKNVILGVRALGIRGCSVSMPYKQEVIKYLDKLDPQATKAGAVNTIVNTGNTLIGYNTDVDGVTSCLKKLKNHNDTVLILGAGGMARAVLVALENLKFSNIELSSRSRKKTSKLLNDFDFEFIPWKEKEKLSSDIIINTTPIGMYPSSSQIPISSTVVKKSNIIVDVISNPAETKFIKLAKKHKKITINGLSLAFQQSLSQFKLYTGKNPPKAKMQKAINEFYE